MNPIAGGDETEHDSDATLSIVSDEDASASQSSAATNPPVNVSMLEAYKIVFDPPVPAVITIPTSILRVSDANDWQTEARALQFLMKKNLERRKNRTKLSQKPTVGREALPSTNDAARKRRDIAQQLFAAIEFKSNQIVSLDRPNFTILHPADSLKKPRKEPKRKISEANAVDVENPPHSKDEKFVRLSGMVDKLELDPFSRDFLENNFQFIEEKQLRKAMRQHHSFKKAMNQILLVTDESLQKELHLVLQEAGMNYKDWAVRENGPCWLRMRSVCWTKMKQRSGWQPTRRKPRVMSSTCLKRTEGSTSCSERWTSLRVSAICWLSTRETCGNGQMLRM